MSKNDEKIKNLLAVIEKKKEEMGPKPKAVLATNGMFKFDERNCININTVNDLQTIVRMYAYILDKSLTEDIAATELGIENYEFTYDGYSLHEWFADFKYKADLIQWNVKNLELSQMEKKLNALMSEDVKTELELENIMAQLG